MFVMHDEKPRGEHKTMSAEQCSDKNCRRRDHYELVPSPSTTRSEEQPIRNVRILVKVREEDGPSPVDHIIEKHLNPVIQLFRKKARDYEANNLFTANLLGSQGQFGDLWRKLPKLYKGLWLKQPLNGEQPREILADFIGHCLLALGFLDEEEKIEFTPPANLAADFTMHRTSDALGDVVDP